MNRAIELRNASSADAGAIAALWHSAWIDGHAEHVSEKVRAARTPASFHIRTDKWITHFRVAMVGPMLMGFHLCKGNELSQFYLASQVRGSGFAKAFIDDAEAAIKRDGHGRAWLACAVGNDRARRFYEKSGWAVTQTETLPFESVGAPVPIEIWRMEKAL